MAHVQEHLAVFAPSVTELILFSVQPTSAGDLSFTVGLTEAQAWPREGRAGCRPCFADGLTNKIASFAAAARAHGVRRVLLCVGGGGRSSGFAALVAAPAARARLVQRVAALCAKHGLHGVDLDWEAPASPEQLSNYAKLIVEVNCYL